MKTILLLTALLATSSTFAATRLMDCNLSSGDTQQATVIQDVDQLILKELDSHGSMSERPLSLKEWEKKTIKIKSESYAKATLTLTADGWWFSYKSPGFNSVGYADCE